MKTVMVEMPEEFLLLLAVHGTMGDGEIPTVMKHWAQSACTKVGLTEDMLQLMEKKSDELRSRLRNVLGEDAVDMVDRSVEQAVSALKTQIRR